MRLLAAIFTGLTAIITLWAAGYGVFALSSITMQPQKTEQITDAIVVLTGGDQRIEAGLDLFARGRAKHLFITGVHPDVRKSDIETMWKGDTALPACCITMGHQAANTIENASETREWIIGQKYTSIRLITSNYHMNRALLELRHTLPGIEIIPNPIKQPNLEPPNQKLWLLLLSEYHKTLFRWVTTVIEPRPPLPHEQKS
jgi:uncharacterized SAM-binding protein YcdF (DUF218 family)